MTLRIAEELADLPHIEVADLIPLQGSLKTLLPREYEKLKNSLLEHGIIVPFFVWRETGQLIDGHQRRHVLLTEGWLQPVPVVYISAVDELDAKRKLLVVSSQYGRVTQAGWQEFTWNIPDAAAIAQFDALPAVFSDPVFMLPEFDPPPNAQPNQRKLPFDMIFTQNGTTGECCVAIRAGFKFGLQSAKHTVDDARVCPYALRSPRHVVTFVDNAYDHYDHAHHVAIVQRFAPKYATVRDVMSPDQCDVAGIAYYPLEQILDWAAELETYAENVIIIPKYDCLDRIPAQYMLGYSIPTSHGGTPLPVEAFRGRRVHLLGGSWRKQLNYMAALGDDVCSADNNYILKQAMFGSFVLPDGDTATLDTLNVTITNPLDVCLALSVGHIGAKLNELRAPGDAVPVRAEIDPDDYADAR